MSFLDIIARLGSHAASHRTVKSAMHPILWLCAITCPMCFWAAYGFSNNHELARILIGTGVGEIIFACLAYAYFAIRDPDRLQSESHVEQKQLFNLISTKKGIVFNPVDVIDLVNPYPENPALALKQAQLGNASQLPVTPPSEEDAEGGNGD